jgi:hypothetical protein
MRHFSPVLFHGTGGTPGTPVYRWILVNLVNKLLTSLVLCNTLVLFRGTGGTPGTVYWDFTYAVVGRVKQITGRPAGAMQADMPLTGAR